MIKKIKIYHFKALKNLEISFSHQVNIISGVNGVGKSSILHLVANAFDDVKRRDFAALPIVCKSNEKWNPKLEDLSLLDKKFGDVARNTNGVLLEITYANSNLCLPFRRQNKRSDAKQGLCRLIPKIPRGSGLSRPIKPRIYLEVSTGTSTEASASSTSIALSPKLAKNIASLETKMLDPKDVVPKKELKSLLTLLKKEFPPQSQTQLKISKPKNLPQNYLKELRKLYLAITGHCIDLADFHKNPKANFVTMKEGVDSRTISLGENRVLDILYALISLKLYYDTTKLEDRSSILLIDELDFALHPKVQRKVLELLRDYSKRYQIQIIATTRNSFLLQDAYTQDKIILLQKTKQKTKNISEEAMILEEIEPNLSYKEQNQLCQDGCIVFFFEDDEAKLLFQVILNYYLNDPLYSEAFQKIKHLIRPIVAALGCFQLEGLMKKLPQWPAFTIVDGDGGRNIQSRIIKLPSYDNTSPERTIHRYYEEELRNKPQNRFWEDPKIKEKTFNKIFDQLQGVQKKKKKTRLIYKKHFKKYIEVYKVLFVSWMQDHPEEMEFFYQDFCKMFNKAAQNAGIPHRMRKIEKPDVPVDPLQT